MSLLPTPRDARPSVRIGMLGYGFMGKAHSNALKTVPYMFWPHAARTDLRAIAGRSEEGVRQAATRFGWEHYTTDWRDLVADPAVDIFVNVAADAAHHAPTLAAIEAGKHVVCEKPLSNDLAEAIELEHAARAAGVEHLTCFNYRFLPAVRHAYELIKQGEIGEIYTANFRYAQEWRTDPEGALPTWTGALDVIGCHAIDQARHLVGEIDTVSAAITNPVTTQERGEPIDTVTALAHFVQGAVGTIAATLVAPGRRNQLRWEINGSKGSITWDLEQLNLLHVYRRAPSAAGFAQVIVCEPGHPFMDVWWPSGHLLGWEHAHINMWAHFIEAVVGRGQVGPVAATFTDGAQAARVARAIKRAAATGDRVAIN